MKSLLSRLSLGFACSLALVGVITMNSTGSVTVRDGNLPSYDAPVAKEGLLNKDSDLLKQEELNKDGDLVKDALEKMGADPILDKLGTDPILEKMGTDPILSADSYL